MKLAYDFANGMEATYTASLFHQNDNAGAETCLRNTSGASVFAGNTNIGGSTTTSPPAAFPTMSIDWKQTHLAQAVTLKSGVRWRFRLGVRRQRL